MITLSTGNGGFLYEVFDLVWVLFCECNYPGDAEEYGYHFGCDPGHALIRRFLLVGAETVPEMGREKGQPQ